MRLDMKLNSYHRQLLSTNICGWNNETSENTHTKKKKKKKKKRKYICWSNVLKNSNDEKYIK